VSAYGTKQTHTTFDNINKCNLRARARFSKVPKSDLRKKKNLGKT